MFVDSAWLSVLFDSLRGLVIMAQTRGLTIDLAIQEGLGGTPVSPQPPLSAVTPRAGAPLVSKATSILSSSYADTEFRDALQLLDERQVHNDAETRRRIRLDLQKEVIDSNGEIVAEFGRVAEVCVMTSAHVFYTDFNSNSKESGLHCKN